MRVAFSKYEGLGNDFVVIDEGPEGPPAAAFGPELAQRICDRHRGVGADGVLRIGMSPQGRPSMQVINADGSVPEMCGNGLRCVALHLARTGRLARITDGQPFEVDTDAGP